MFGPQELRFLRAIFFASGSGLRAVNGMVRVSGRAGTADLALPVRRRSGHLVGILRQAQYERIPAIVASFFSGRPRVRLRRPQAQRPSRAESYAQRANVGALICTAQWQQEKP